MIPGCFPPYSPAAPSSSQELYLDKLNKAIQRNNGPDIAYYFERLAPLPKEDLAQAISQYANRVRLFEDKEHLLSYKQALQSSLISIIKSDPSLRQNIEAILPQYFVGDSKARFCGVLCSVAFDQKDRDLSLLMCDIMNKQEVFCWEIKAYFSLFIELCSEGSSDKITSCFELMQRKRPPDYGSLYPPDLIKEAVDEHRALEVILRGALRTKNEDILLYCLVAVYQIYLRRKRFNCDANLYESISSNVTLTELEPWALKVLLSSSQQEPNKSYYVESLLFFLFRNNNPILEPLVHAIEQLPDEAQSRSLTRLMTVKPFDAKSTTYVHNMRERFIDAFPHHFDLISVTIEDKERKILQSSLITLAPERFSRALEGPFREKSEKAMQFISFKDCTECEAFLKFLACQDMTIIDETTVIGLLQLALLNEIHGLGNACVNFISEKLTIEDKEAFLSIFTSLMNPDSPLALPAEYILDLKWLFLTYACNTNEVYEYIKSQNNPHFLTFLSECDRCRAGNIRTTLPTHGMRCVTYKAAVSECHALTDRLANLHLSESILASAKRLRLHTLTTDKELVGLSHLYPHVVELTVSQCKDITTFAGCAFTKLVDVDAKDSGLTDEGLKALFDQNKDTLKVIHAPGCPISTAANYAGRCNIIMT